MTDYCDAIEGEVWRQIAGEREGLEISSRGRVRDSIKQRMRKLTVTSHGYHVVNFKEGGKVRLNYIHDLVADTFLGGKPPKMTINHIDGVKTNNNVENLEIVTQSENMHHAHRTKLCDNRGERHGSSKLTEENVQDIVAQFGKGVSDASIGRQFNVGSEAIRRIRIGKGWRHISSY